MCLSPPCEFGPSEDLHSHDTLLDISHVPQTYFPGISNCNSKSGCVMASTLLPCSHLHEINDSLARCLFVRDSADCHDDEGFISYIDFTYCGPHSPYFPLAVLSLWLLVLFAFLGITADDFLCPALVVISKVLRLSESVAGVTLVAFGNGAPDIISSLTGIQQARPSLVIGELFGAGTFVTTVVAGAVFFTPKFQLDQEAFIRDSIFYLGASYWAFYLFYRKNITLLDAAGFICVYLVYICVVILSHVYSSRNNEEPDLEEPYEPLSHNGDEDVDTGNDLLPVVDEFIHASTSSQRPSHLLSHHDNALRHFLNSMESHRSTASRSPSISSVQTQEVLDAHDTPVEQQYHGVPFLTVQPSQHPSNRSPSPTEKTPLLGQNSETMSPVSELILHVIPCSFEEFREMTITKKCLTAITFPVQIILLLTIPVVDYENDKNNWCKLLNCFHCIAAPLVIVFFSGIALDTLWSIPISAWVTLLGACLAIVVYATSAYDVQPVYHNAFGCLGFFAAGMWTYGICQEVMALLKTAGIVFGLSDAILGLTVLAWGNSLGDLVTDTTVAKQGFPKMAISACFGGQLLNLLLGIGIPYTILLSQTSSHEVQIESEPVVSVLYGALTASLVITSVYMLFTRYRSSRINACILFAVYVIFLITAIAVATQTT